MSNERNPLNFDCRAEITDQREVGEKRQATWWRIFSTCRGSNAFTVYITMYKMKEEEENKERSDLKEYLRPGPLQNMNCLLESS